MELTVRLYMCGEYENTLIVTIDISEDSEEDMETMMRELSTEMEDQYGDHEEWGRGEITWVLDSWEKL